MVLEEAAAGFLYSLRSREAQPAKRSLRSKAGHQLVTRFLGVLRGGLSGARSRARRRASVPGCGIVQAHGHGNISSNRPLPAAARGAGGPRKREPTQPVLFIYAR